VPYAEVIPPACDYDTIYARRIVIKTENGPIELTGRLEDHVIGLRLMPLKADSGVSEPCPNESPIRRVE